MMLNWKSTRCKWFVTVKLRQRAQPLFRRMPKRKKIVHCHLIQLIPEFRVSAFAHLLVLLCIPQWKHTMKIQCGTFLFADAFQVHSVSKLLAEHFNGTHSTCTTTLYNAVCATEQTNNKVLATRHSFETIQNSQKCVAVVYRDTECKLHSVKCISVCRLRRVCLDFIYSFFSHSSVASSFFLFFRRRVDGCVCVCIQLFGVYCQQRYCAVCSIQNY